MQILTIARVTIKEASRRKLLLALLIITAVVIAASTYGFYRLSTMEVTERGSGLPHRLPTVELRAFTAGLLILIMFMFTGVLALSSALTAAPAVAAEVESGVVLTLLTRPISRSEVILGKWLGLAVLATAYVAGASMVEFFLVNQVTGYFPPDPLGFIAFLTGQTLVLMTLALVLSTRVNTIASVMVVLAVYFAAWMGGIANAIGQAFDNQDIITIGTVSRLLVPSDGLWHGAIYSLEPAAMISAAQAAGRGTAANPFFATSPPPVPYLVWCVAWLALVLGAAILSFSRREL